MNPGLLGMIALLDRGLILIDVRDMPTITERNGRRRVGAAGLANVLLDYQTSGPRVAAL